MIVATWNVNSVRVRLCQLISFLRDNNVDVILLQELKCTTEMFPYEPLEDIGYNCLVYGQKTYNGVAILSKHKIEEQKIGSDIFRGDTHARYVEALINGFTIASVYVPNGGLDTSLDPFFYKLRFIDILTTYLSNIAKTERLIIGGDFNITRGNIDVYDPKLWAEKVCCTSEERLAFHDMLDVGLIDNHRKIAGTEKIYTWWDYRRESFRKNHGLRIDYMLTTNNVSVTRCMVDVQMRELVRPSDHAPIIMDVLQ
ncbi:MAG: exodeoxyribonuclease III [Holosporales bacterium]|jgi:exodeoxyribonuclease-3|nr:exodeoxyribonuclease III [Holosporales bacterium]